MSGVGPASASIVAVSGMNSAQAPVAVSPRITVRDITPEDFRATVEFVATLMGGGVISAGEALVLVLDIFAGIRRLQTFIEELREPWAQYFSPLLSSLRQTVLDAARATIGDLVQPADDVTPAENRANAYAGFCDTLDVAIAEAWQLLREKGLDPGSQA